MSQNQATLIKRKNYLLIGAVVTLLFGLIWLLMDGQSRPTQNIEKDLSRVLETNINKGTALEDHWLQISEERFKKLEQQTQKLQGNLSSIEKENEKLKREKEALDDQLKQLQVKIQEQKPLKPESLKPKLTQQTTSSSNNDIYEKGFIQPLQQGHNSQSQKGPVQTEIALPQTIQKFTLKDPKNKAYKEYDLANYLPAGSYVKATVISGVDASVGVSSQTDPRPVLFRISGKAQTARFEGKTQEVDLTGCVVTGAAYGDLSSEKVYVRLQKMACSKKEGRVIETKVKGYPSYLGKVGVRGHVVSREGDLVMQSFLAGVIGSIGKTASSALAPQKGVLNIAKGTENTYPDVTDVLGQSVGEGINQSSDRVADYLLKRAEQYQPVVVMQAGTQVELVFIEGVYIDGKNRNKKSGQTTN